MRVGGWPIPNHMSSNNIPFPPSLSSAQNLMERSPFPKESSTASISPAVESESKVEVVPEEVTPKPTVGSRAHVFPRERVEAAMQRAAAKDSLEA